MQMKVLKVRYLESKKVLQNKCRRTRTEYYIVLIGWQAYRGDQGHWKNSPT